MPTFIRNRPRNLLSKCPRESRRAKKIRLAKMGESGKGGAGAGDLYLKVKIKKPLLRKIKDIISDLTPKSPVI